MKFRLYSGLECDQFKSVLTIARTLGTLAIVGFYITLMLAANAYFNFSAAENNLLQTPASMANGILVEGFVVCLLAFITSVVMAWFVAGKQNTSNQFVGQTL